MSSSPTSARRTGDIQISMKRAAALIKAKNERLEKPANEEKTPLGMTGTSRVRDLISRYEPKPQPTKTLRDLPSPTVTATLPSVPPLRTCLPHHHP